MRAFPHRNSGHEGKILPSAEALGNELSIQTAAQHRVFNTSEKKLSLVGFLVVVCLFKQREIFMHFVLH